LRFQKKAIFFAAPGDMSAARDYVIAAVDRRIQELSKDGEFRTYCYNDEEYPNAANTWQAEIASPLDPNCVLTVVLWGERIGPLPLFTT
jgi:hypothetical protein